MKKLLLILASVVCLHAQSPGPVARITTGASLPASCSVGQQFQLTSNPAGQQWYLCTSSNTWSQQGGGGGGSITYPSAGVVYSSGTAFATATATNIGAVWGCSGTQLLQNNGTCIAQAAIVTGYAPLSSPSLTGSPTAPTATTGTSTTQIATTAFVQAALAATGNAIPSTTGMLKGNGSGAAVAATAGTDYQAPISAGTYATPAQITSAVSGLAPLASPSLTGTPTAPTQTTGDSSTRLATTAFVATAISGVSSGTSIASVTSDPGSPTAGQIWYRSDTGILNYYNGGAVERLPGSTSVNASFAMGSINDMACADHTVTFTGISTGTPLTPIWPTGLPSGVTGMVFPSAPNTATVRLCNFSGATQSVGSLSYTIFTGGSAAVQTVTSNVVTAASLPTSCNVSGQMLMVTTGSGSDHLNMCALVSGSFSWIQIF